jgi:hypothetical protein
MVMDVKATINKIREACDELSKTYAQLAELALPAMDGLNTSIGRLKQWECVLTTGESPIGPIGTVVHFDEQPSWFARIFGGIVVVGQIPHPRANEALERVKQLFATADAGDNKFEADVSDVADTPKAICASMEKWLTVADKFTISVATAIPTNAAYIPTSGELDGWLGDAATGAYGATLSSQDSAATTTASTMRSYLEQCAGFLSSLNGSLRDLAWITVAQTKFYGSIITGIPDSISFDGVMKLIDTGFEVVTGLQSDEIDKMKALGDMATSTITSLLKMSELEANIVAMGEGAPGWPAPAPMNVKPYAGKPTSHDLRWNAQYFKDHSVFWNTVSCALSTIRDKASESTKIPVMFTRIPTFSADRSAALNSLDETIVSQALAKGATNTQSISDLLVSTMKAYLHNEAANQALADQISAEVFG